MADELDDLKSLSSYLTKIQDQWKDVKKNVSDANDALKDLVEEQKRYSSDYEANDKKIEKLQKKKSILEEESKLLNKKTQQYRTLQLDIKKTEQDILDVLNESGEIQEHLYRLKEVEEYAQLYKNHWKAINDDIEKSLFIYNRIMLVLKKSVDYFSEYDKILQSVSYEFGLTRVQSEQLYNNLGNIVDETLEFGAGMQDVLQITSQLTNQFGVIGFENFVEINKQILFFNKAFGVSYETSAKFVSTLSQISGESFNSQKNMFAFAKSVADANNVKLNVLMEQVANSSDTVRTIFRGNTEQLIEQTAELIKINSSLESAAKSAQSLLNFQSSFQSELKASALLGETMNLNEARRLFFQGKIAEGEKLLVERLKEIGDYDRLNYFQKQAIADAVGKSVTEVQKLIAQEKTLRDIREKFPEYTKRELELNQQLEKLRGNKEEQQKRSLELQAKENIANTQANIITEKRLQIVRNIGKALEPLAKLYFAIYSGLLSVLDVVSGFAAKFPLITSGLVGIITLLPILGTSFLAVSKIVQYGFLNVIKLIPETLFNLGKSIGSFITGTISSITEGMKKINPVQLARTSLALISIAVALGSLGLALKTFKDGPSSDELIKTGIALASFATMIGIMGAGPIAAAILVGSAALIGVSTALFLFGKSLQNVPSGDKLSNLGTGLKEFSSGLFQLMSVAIMSPFSMIGLLPISLAIGSIGSASEKYAESINRFGIGFRNLSDSVLDLVNNSAGVDRIFDSLNKLSDIDDFNGNIKFDISPETQNVFDSISDSTIIMKTLNSSIEKLNEKIEDLKNSIKDQDVNVYVDGQQLNYAMANSEKRRGTFGITSNIG